MQNMMKTYLIGNNKNAATSLWDGWLSNHFSNGDWSTCEGSRGHPTINVGWRSAEGTPAPFYVFLLFSFYLIFSKFLCYILISIFLFFDVKILHVELMQHESEHCRSYCLMKFRWKSCLNKIAKPRYPKVTFLK